MKKQNLFLCLLYTSLLFGLILFCGCTESPTGEVISNPETKYVCLDGSVVDDPQQCTMETTTTTSITVMVSTTTTEITTTSKPTITTTTFCEKSKFAVGNLVETTPKYDSKGGYTTHDKHVEGKVTEVEEISCGAYLIRIKTDDEGIIGLQEKWLQFKTTTTTIPLMEEGYLDAKKNDIEEDIRLKANLFGVRNKISYKGIFGDRRTLVPTDKDWKFAIIEIALKNNGRETKAVNGDFKLEVRDRRIFDRRCTYTDIEGYYTSCYTNIKIPPGTTKKTKIIFEIPEYTTPLFLIYEQDNWFTEEKFKYDLRKVVL